MRKTEMLDIADVLDRFTGHLPKAARVLDVGARAGRDAKEMIARLRGRRAGAIREAGAPSPIIPGLDVLKQRAEELEEVARYDGIWACASLLHLDGPQLDMAIGPHLRRAQASRNFLGKLQAGTADNSGRGRAPVS